MDSSSSEKSKGRASRRSSGGELVLFMAARILLCVYGLNAGVVLTALL
jgi:hypothetical protein